MGRREEKRREQETERQTGRATDRPTWKLGIQTSKRSLHDDDKHLGERCQCKCECEQKPKGHDQCCILVRSQKRKEVHCRGCTRGKEDTAGWRGKHKKKRKGLCKRKREKDEQARQARFAASRDWR